MTEVIKGRAVDECPFSDRRSERRMVCPSTAEIAVPAIPRLPPIGSSPTDLAPA